ncbi:MAG: hypothetical protein AABX64_00460 [Nanoarchaeota archaeon]
MTYRREEAEKIIKINREQLNISDEQTALAYAIDCGKGEEMTNALQPRIKQRSLFGIFRSSGESLIDILERVCRSESTSEHELTLDEKSAENGKKKTADEWIKYWNKIKDGRVMASMGDLYANFKIIKKMRESGTAEGQAKAQSYLNGLREDFIWESNEGGLIANTRLFYSANSLDARVVQHYKCKKPELTKERVIEVPVYEGTLIEEVADSGSGLTYLQTILDTEDDAEIIIQTLEFIGSKSRSDIFSWTAPTKSEKYYTRAKMPERAVWLNSGTGRFYLNCSSSPISGIGRARRVRGASVSEQEARK